MSSSSEQIHAEALKRSGPYYDEIKTFRATLANSASPGEWLTVLHAESSGLETETANSVAAIVDSYWFGPRFRTRKIPVDEFGRPWAQEEPAQHFLQIHDIETKGITFVGECGTQVKSDPVVYSEARSEDIRSVVTAQEVEPESSTEFLPFEGVSAAAINTLYEKYLNEKVTADEVMNAVIDFVRRKIEKGSSEHTLRERGQAGDLLSVFWNSMSKAVRDKRFTGEKKDSKFFHYMSSAWSNTRNAAYEKLEKEDSKFESSASWIGNASTRDPLVSASDLSAVKANRNALLEVQEAVMARELLAEHMVGMKGPCLLMVQDMIQGIGQQVTAGRLGVTRHVVGRVQRGFKTAVRNGKT